MLLANKLGGFSLTESDDLRKLLVKPSTSLAEEMKKEREDAGEKFINGCMASGISRERAERLWYEEIFGFISYGFNKSHAISYAYISYICGYLLTYHEEEWIRAYLENDNDRDKAISDVESIGYKVGKIDINRSGLDWEIKDKIIYPSITTLKGIGMAAAEELCRVREELGGVFTDIDHMLYENGFTKTGKPKKLWRWSKLNKRAIESLIKCEAFDSIALPFENYKHMFETIIQNYNTVKRGTQPLQKFINETICNDWENFEKIDFQKELIGTYDRGLLFSEKALQAFKELDIVSLSEISEESKYIWFILKNYERKTTKNNKPYLKLNISDIEGTSKMFNYFGPHNDLELKRNQLYVGTLYLNNGWINSPYGTKIIKIE